MTPKSSSARGRAVVGGSKFHARWARSSSFSALGRKRLCLRGSSGRERKSAYFQQQSPPKH